MSNKDNAGAVRVSLKQNTIGIVTAAFANAQAALQELLSGDSAVFWSNSCFEKETLMRKRIEAMLPVGT